MKGGRAPRAAGDRFERGCVMRLRDLGYLVVRSAGSFGPADIWAARADIGLILISCKVTDKTTNRERLQFHEAATGCGGIPIIAAKDKTRIVWHRITDDGTRVPYEIGVRTWPNDR